jgi:O-acetyl-ADP-ribose deacetylase (regulator of RNase III)
VNPIIEREIHGTKILVIDGDITKLETDAIVNPANSHLIMGGGAAGAILRAGGNEVQKEALKKAPVAIGNAVATTGGKLKAKYVIHAPTMTRPAMPTSQENARLATKAALETAHRLGIKSIALPGMGTGVGGLEPQTAADAMVSEIRKHVEANTTLKQVILVGYNPRMTQAFEKAVRDIPQQHR